ncbi:MAG TPA: toxin PIN [Firmicutes bacterium]|nr:toxin PIN [Bacillota bacterium]
MTFITIIISLIIIGLIAHISGNLIEKIKIPSLMGMMIAGMIIGPYVLNIVPSVTLSLAPFIKDIALVTVLFIAGLGISKAQMQKIGRPAVLLSVIPATLEGFAIALLSMVFLDFTFIQGAILGFIIAAVSPAVLIPSMLALIDQRLGENKSIPQMLLVGASADDTVAITLFTSFLAIYTVQANGGNASFINQMMMIPITIVVSIAVAYVVAKGLSFILPKLKFGIVLVFGICLIMRLLESNLHLSYFNSLLTVMMVGFFLRYFINDMALQIQQIMNQVWKYGKLYLFIFVGMAINPMLVKDYFFVGFGMLAISLTVRSCGVWLSLLGTDLNLYERLFCVVAYLPKATVQSAKAGIPLQMGVAGGEVMQALAILSVLITAPIGAIGIRLTAPKWLEQAENNQS